MLTNDEASTSKLACVERGYLRDDFVHRFARRGRKYSPLINRGYYARVLAMRRVLDAFLAVSLTNDPADASKRARRQIVSLGAGFDTTWFRLRAEGREPARYIEVDHAPVVAKKVAIVNEADDMRALCVGGAGLAPLERLAESDPPPATNRRPRSATRGDTASSPPISAMSPPSTPPCAPRVSTRPFPPSSSPSVASRTSRMTPPPP